MVWIRSTTTLDAGGIVRKPLHRRIGCASFRNRLAGESRPSDDLPADFLDREDNSSVPDDTVCTLTEVSSAAEATALTSAED